MKKLIGAMFVAVAVFSCGSAFADSITGVVTGDDNISYWNGSSWTALGTSWPTAETVNLIINQSSEEVYFAVSNNNWYPGGDPAGFLGSFTDTTPGGTFVQTGTNTLVSNTSIWKVLPSAPFNSNLPGPVPLNEINPTTNPTTLTGWITPTSYGKNGTGIWQAVNGGPVNGISNNAQWIWTANNDQTFGTQDDYAYFEIDLGVNPVPTPEAPTLLLFVMAGAMVLFLMRKNVIKVA